MDSFVPSTESNRKSKNKPKSKKVSEKRESSQQNDHQKKVNESKSKKNPVKRESSQKNDHQKKGNEPKSKKISVKSELSQQNDHQTKENVSKSKDITVKRESSQQNGHQTKENVPKPKKISVKRQSSQQNNHQTIVTEKTETITASEPKPKKIVKKRITVQSPDTCSQTIEDVIRQSVSQDEVPEEINNIKSYDTYSQTIEDVIRQSVSQDEVPEEINNIKSYETIEDVMCQSFDLSHGELLEELSPIKSQSRPKYIHNLKKLKRKQENTENRLLRRYKFSSVSKLSKFLKQSHLNIIYKFINKCIGYKKFVVSNKSTSSNKHTHFPYPRCNIFEKYQCIKLMHLIREINKVESNNKISNVNYKQWLKRVRSKAKNFRNMSSFKEKPVKSSDLKNGCLRKKVKPKNVNLGNKVIRCTGNMTWKIVSNNKENSLKEDNILKKNNSKNASNMENCIELENTKQSSHNLYNNFCKLNNTKIDYLKTTSIDKADSHSKCCRKEMNEFDKMAIVKENESRENIIELGKANGTNTGYRNGKILGKVTNVDLHKKHWIARSNVDNWITISTKHQSFNKISTNYGLIEEHCLKKYVIIQQPHHMDIPKPNLPCKNSLRFNQSYYDNSNSSSDYLSLLANTTDFQTEENIKPVSQIIINHSSDFSDISNNNDPIIGEDCFMNPGSRNSSECSKLGSPKIKRRVNEFQSTSLLNLKRNVRVTVNKMTQFEIDCWTNKRSSSEKSIPNTKKVNKEISTLESKLKSSVETSNDKNLCDIVSDMESIGKTSTVETNKNSLSSKNSTQKIKNGNVLKRKYNAETKDSHTLTDRYLISKRRKVITISDSKNKSFNTLNLKETVLPEMVSECLELNSDSKTSHSINSSSQNMSSKRSKLNLCPQNDQEINFSSKSRNWSNDVDKEGKDFIMSKYLAESVSFEGNMYDKEDDTHMINSAAIVHTQDVDVDDNDDEDVDSNEDVDDNEADDSEDVVDKEDVDDNEDVNDNDDVLSLFASESIIDYPINRMREVQSTNNQQSMSSKPKPSIKKLNNSCQSRTQVNSSSSNEPFKMPSVLNRPFKIPIKKSSPVSFNKNTEITNDSSSKMVPFEGKITTNVTTINTSTIDSKSQNVSNKERLDIKENNCSHFKKSHNYNEANKPTNQNFPKNTATETNKNTNEHFSKNTDSNDIEADKRADQHFFKRNTTNDVRQNTKHPFCKKNGRL
uniref:Uncharacterized protein n=1 Tax=Clastoptera arizonana TaxID=38151 RepID=A0A1B6CX75_9HEMI